MTIKGISGTTVTKTPRRLVEKIVHYPHENGITEMVIKEGVSPERVVYYPHENGITRMFLNQEFPMDAFVKNPKKKPVTSIESNNKPVIQINNNTAQTQFYQHESGITELD